MLSTPAAAAFDRDGNLLLLMINKEYGLFGSTAFGVELAGGVGRKLADDRTRIDPPRTGCPPERASTCR